MASVCLVRVRLVALLLLQRTDAMQLLRGQASQPPCYGNDGGSPSGAWMPEMTSCGSPCPPGFWANPAAACACVDSSTATYAQAYTNARSPCGVGSSIPSTDTFVVPQSQVVANVVGTVSKLTTTTADPYVPAADYQMRNDFKVSIRGNVNIAAGDLKPTPPPPLIVPWPVPSYGEGMSTSGAPGVLPDGPDAAPGEGAPPGEGADIFPPIVPGVPAPFPLPAAAPDPNATQAMLDAASKLTNAANSVVNAIKNVTSMVPNNADGSGPTPNTSPADANGPTPNTSPSTNPAGTSVTMVKAAGADSDVANAESANIAAFGGETEGGEDDKKCLRCAEEFKFNGGCDAFKDGHEIGKLIPDGCLGCGHTTIEYCHAA